MQCCSSVSLDWQCEIGQIIENFTDYLITGIWTHLLDKIVIAQHIKPFCTVAMRVMPTWHCRYDGYRMVNLVGIYREFPNKTLEWPRVSHRITLNLPMASPVVKTHRKSRSNKNLMLTGKLWFNHDNSSSFVSVIIVVPRTTLD